MKIKSVFFEYLKANKKTFLALLIMFFIGIVIGIVFINNISENNKNEICLYVNSLKENIKKSSDINRKILLIQSIKQNINFILIIWVLGCTILGSFLIYLAVAYKGFSIGYTISAIIATLGIRKGIVFSMMSLVMQNLVFLPIMFILSEKGIKLYRNLKKNKFSNIKTELFGYLLILAISILFSMIASFIEIYISTNFLIFFKEIL